ncbi:MAG: hypothetical protein HS105_05350 [Chloracidobacterium sp.]|nr:hypothetical protein [Chloracidobacterium sp.]
MNDKLTEDYFPEITIYADGSCLRNGSEEASAGCGAVIVDRHRMELRLISRHLGSLTNQQAEISACTMALGTLRRPCIVEIVSDSRYVVETMTGKNRMKSNRSFWSDLVTRCYRHHVSWRWVRGHSGVTFQEAADRLSRAASTYQCSLPDEELQRLSKLLLLESNRLNIRAFEKSLEATVSRLSLSVDCGSVFSNVDLRNDLPSAFSV